MTFLTCSQVGYQLRITLPVKFVSLGRRNVNNNNNNNDGEMMVHYPSQ